MRVLTCSNTDNINSGIKRLILALGISTLYACVGGSGGGINSNKQDPDPVVLDRPIAYVKKPMPVDGLPSPRRALTFISGGDLYLKNTASAGAAETNITYPVTNGTGDVKDVSVSFDGSRLLFSLKLEDIPGADPEDQPTWNIWEYDIESASLRRVIASDITAEEGQDLSPHYLPDGRIVFSSSRQRKSKAVLLDEGKPQYAQMTNDGNEAAMVLHVMDEAGGNIQQISFNHNHDLSPVIQDNGSILFSRWTDHSGNNFDLYRILPDGSELQMQYGSRSHSTGTDNTNVQFLNPRLTENGRAITLLQSSNTQGGDLVNIDTANYVDYDIPTWENLTVLSAPGQIPATSNTVNTTAAPSPGGRYSSAFPLQDGTDRLLVAWSQCRLIVDEELVPCTTEALADPAAQEAPPVYGVWLYDPATSTQLPITAPAENILITDVVAAQPRTLPALLTDKQAGVELNEDFVAEGVGILHLRSVYDEDGTDTTTTGISVYADPAQTIANERPARFIRLIKRVAIPDDDTLDFPNTAFGRTSAFGMREILGYGMIEPDGSVKIKVPSNIEFSFDILDQNGRRISSPHRHWLQLRPGEEKECHGCHDASSTYAHGRPDAEPPAVNSGATSSGNPFPNTEPALLAIAGETMAETRARISCEQSNCSDLTPAVDIQYSDYWTDPAVRAKDPSFNYNYSDLDTLPPIAGSCLTQWTNLCRTIINYEQHIQPLWSNVREVLDNNGVVIEDRTCTSCHTTTDANGNPQVPEAQLDLQENPSTDEPDHFTSYRELLFTDNEQELVDGVLQDRLVQATDQNGQPLFETDANGDLILDQNGQPVPIMTTVRAQGPSMNAGSANASYFLSKFDSGGTHSAWLSTAELRLISEWLDIGAQYYNNPFSVPVN